MNEEKDLLFLIDKIVTCDLFREANYYIICMKKQPHGGIAHIFHPNVYLKHYTPDIFKLFTHEPDNIPHFLLALVENAYQEFLKCEVDVEEVCRLCFEDDMFWHVGFRLLRPKKVYEEENKNSPLIWSVISSKLRFQDYFEFDLKLLIYALVCYLIKSKMIEIDGIAEICKHEVLRIPHNKYGLSPVNEAKFLRQGLIIDQRYYLYNIFFDTSIEAAFDDVPYTIKIINEEIPKKNLFFRCDEKIAVPADKMISTATMDFQKYRGITVDFVNIDKLVNKKEIIVHYDPKHLDKIVMIIKPDMDQDGCKFYHIEVEELWSPKKVKDNFVTTNYIHSQYYPDNRIFNHIDFSVNQYSKSVFEEKFMDAVTDTKIPIDKYGDEHYKIWCVVSDVIKLSTWSKLFMLRLMNLSGTYS